MAFKEFMLDDGQIVSLPEHYAEHPVFGKRLIAIDEIEGEVETDKVVSDDHALPLEQRITHVVSDSSEDEDGDDYDDIKDNN